MIIISMTAVPIFHRAGVFTAYEYLERRFDAKTRLLVSILFLIQRGLAVGVSLSAPAIVLTVIFGWRAEVTTAVMGVIIVTYTVLGGIKAITWTDVQQMIIMFCGLLTALIIAVHLLPADISFFDAIRLAGAAGRINPVTTTVDWNDRYNLFSGLIGGMFLALSYFGCDQSPEHEGSEEGHGDDHSACGCGFGPSLASTRERFPQGGAGADRRHRWRVHSAASRIRNGRTASNTIATSSGISSR